MPGAYKPHYAVGMHSDPFGASHDVSCYYNNLSMVILAWPAGRPDVLCAMRAYAISAHVMTLLI